MKNLLLKLSILISSAVLLLVMLGFPSKVYGTNLSTSHEAARARPVSHVLSAAAMKLSLTTGTAGLSGVVFL